MKKHDVQVLNGNTLAMPKKLSNIYRSE